MHGLRWLLWIVLALCIVSIIWQLPITTHTTPPHIPITNKPWLALTYEQGDILGGFVHKLGAAFNRLGVTTMVVPNWQGAHYFFHTAYRPDRYRPRIEPWQNVFYNVENFRLDPQRGETVLQTRRLEADQAATNKILYVPWSWVSFEERPSMPNTSLLLRDAHSFDAATVLRSKTRFCAFLAQHCTYESAYLHIYGAHMQGIKLDRTTFFETLSATYKPVDALGRCHHNRDPPPVPATLKQHARVYAGYTPPWSVNDGFIYYMKDYRFAMVFENAATPGYMTEKLFNAYLGRTIPIYWGDPLIDQLVNPEAFVWCRKNTSDPLQPWNTCIQRVRELDQDPVKYIHTLQQPILYHNRIPDWMSETLLAQNLLTLWNNQHVTGSQ